MLKRKTLSDCYGACVDRDLARLLLHDLGILLCDEDIIGIGSILGLIGLLITLHLR